MRDYFILMLRDIESERERERVRERERGGGKVETTKSQKER